MSSGDDETPSEDKGETAEAAAAEPKAEPAAAPKAESAPTAAARAKAEAPKKVDSPKAEPAKDEESEGGLLPALLVGAGLLAVVALLLFGGGDDDDEGGKGGDDKAAVASADGGGEGAGGRAGKGGVAARPTDAPSRRGPVINPKINPRVQLPGVGMAPQAAPKADKPPENATEEELIAWYEKKLEIAKRMLEQRQTFKDRLPQIRERIENSDAPERDKQLEAFEGRQKLVEKNFEDAKKKVEDYEAKLAELRGE